MAYVGKKPQPFYLGQVDDLNVNGGADVTEGLTVDTDTLVVDATNNRVGVNQPSPAEALDVIGDAILSTTGSNDVGVLHFGDTPDDTKIVGRGGVHATEPDTMEFYTNNTSRMTIAANGGVGIGTESSPDQLLEVYGATPFIDLYDSTTGTWDGEDVFSGINFRTADADGSGAGAVHGYIKSVHTRSGTGHNNADAGLVFGASNGTTPAAVERMRIDQNGNVGIGTSSPASLLHLESSEPIIRIKDSDGSAYHQIFAANNDLYIDADRGNSASSNLIFRNDNSEAMRIDSSGNLLVNCTSAKTQGTAVSGGNPILQVEGDIVPSIWAGLTGHSDLGDSTYNYEDAYVRDGVTTTSDRNEKQDIEELSEAEQRVAVAVKSLLRKYRWISSVAEKGDDARIHFGIIAQDLQAAFEAEGLDAHRYGMFMSNTWWETQTEVPAVEAKDAVLDEEGNVIEEAVEAKEAYTRTDTYDTAEEAPEGAVERTRLGVRYSELLAFIIAAL